MYKTMIRPVTIYEIETTILNKDEAEKPKILERKIVRTIIGLKKISENKFRQLMND